MRAAFVILTLNGHSGARAPIKIAEHLFKLGEDVEIYTTGLNLDQDLKKKLSQLGIKIEVIGLFSLLNLLKKRKPQFISFHSTLPYQIICKLSSILIIKTYYGSQLVRMNLKEEERIGLKTSVVRRTFLKMVDFVVLLIERISFFLANKTVGISKSTQAEAKKYFGEKINYIYLGSDLAETDKFWKSSGDKEIKIISVSRLVPYKGFHLLMDAFKKAQIPNSKLLIIGSFPRKDYLEYLKKISNENIEIILNISDLELLDYYKECSFYASATTWEGFGMPFLEAGRFGKPAVGFQNSSLPEVVRHSQTGLLAKNQEEFVEYLSKLGKDSELRDKLGQGAKEFSRSFTWKQTALEYKQFFESL